jgi:drug/metabolite transporter (DMT)-like permease
MRASRDGQGLLLCLLSAAGSGTLAVLGKLAYRNDIDLVTLLAGRYTLAALLFWAVVFVLRRPLPAARATAAGLVLGLTCFALQSALFFAALTRIDAALADLLIFVYPVLVTLAAVALGRERLSRRRAVALSVALTGVTLVLLGGGGVPVDPRGAALALGSAVVYSAYILASASLLRRVDPLVLAALVTTGAAAAFDGFGVLRGGVEPALGVRALALIAFTAIVPTVLVIAAFLGGVRRIGPSRASILSTVEPVVTAALAFVVFGDRLGSLQLGGAGLVLAAVILLEARLRRRRGPALA